MIALLPTGTIEAPELNTVQVKKVNTKYFHCAVRVGSDGFWMTPTKPLTISESDDDGNERSCVK